MWPKHVLMIATVCFFSFLVFAQSDASNRRKLYAMKAKKWKKSIKKKLLSKNEDDRTGAYLTIGGMGGTTKIGDLWYANELCPVLEKTLMRRPAWMYGFHFPEWMFLRFTDPRCPSETYLRFLVQRTKRKKLKEKTEITLFTLFPQSDAVTALLQKQFLLDPMKGLESALLAKDLKLLQPHVQTKMKNLLFQWLYQLQKEPSERLLDKYYKLLRAVRFLLRKHSFVSDVFFRLFQSLRKKDYFDKLFYDFAITYASFIKSHPAQKKQMIFWAKERIQKIEKETQEYKEKYRSKKVRENHEESAREIFLGEKEGEKTKLYILLVALGDQTYFSTLLRMSELTCEDVGVNPKFCPPRTRPNLKPDASTLVETIAFLPVSLRKKYVILIKNFLHAMHQMRKEGDMYYGGGYHRDIQHTIIVMCEDLGRAGRPLLPNLKSVLRRGVLYDDDVARYYRLKKAINNIKRASR